MITLVFCLHRRPDLTPEEFYHYWRNTHGPLVAARAPILRMRRYVQLHRLGAEWMSAVADARAAPEPYDGVAQVSWDSIEELRASAGDPQGRRAARELLEDERNFIDLKRSPIFFTQQHVIVGGADGPA